jgi:hypothetical protein
MAKSYRPYLPDQEFLLPPTQRRVFMLAAATGSRDRDKRADLATGLTDSKDDWLTPRRNSGGNSLGHYTSWECSPNPKVLRVITGVRSKH